MLRCPRVDDRCSCPLPLLLFQCLLFQCLITGGVQEQYVMDPTAGPLVLPSDLLEDKRPSDQRPQPAPPGNSFIIHVIGERHSGTNNLETLMKACLRPNTTMVLSRFISGGWDRLGTLRSSPSLHLDDQECCIAHR